MINKIKYCQNCGHEIEEGAKICKRCNLVAANNLENFLLSKYKLLAVIGVFAALSVYLSSTAVSRSNNEFLNYGSYLGLSIVILLSMLFGWDLIWYSKNILHFPFDGEEHHLEWFKLGFRFAIILLFASFFITTIGFISLYILSTRIDVATSLVLTIIVDFLFFLMISTFYFPIRSYIESGKNIFRFIVVFILIFLQFFTVGFYFTGHTDDVFALLLPLFMIIVAHLLMIRSCWLIFSTMSDGQPSFLSKKFVKEILIEPFKRGLSHIKQIDLKSRKDPKT